jgi:site-specific recombinase XerD
MTEQTEVLLGKPAKSHQANQSNLSRCRNRLLAVPLLTAARRTTGFTIGKATADSERFAEFVDGSLATEQLTGNLGRNALSWGQERGNCDTRGGRDGSHKFGEAKMASLYKKPVMVTDPKTGKRIKAKSRKWWGRYRDEYGLEKRIPLAADKTAAQAMLNAVVLKTERRAAGIEDPFEKHHKRALKDHLEDFKANMEDKGSTADYVQTTVHRVRSVLTACKFGRIDQISASRVQEFLADLRKEGKSVASSNHYLRAIKMFSRWIVRDRRASDDRLAHLSKMNSDLDRRRVRRPLSMEEFGLLLQAAEAGPDIQHISGPDRAILYIVGAYTGYRRNEIGSVTLRSFDFKSNPPTLTVAAGYSKHRRTDVLPLRKDFAQRIQAWVSGKPKVRRDESLFKITGKRTAAMLQKDLEVARAKWLDEADDEAARQQREATSFLAYENELGQVVDFHALRMTFITNLTRSGTAPKTAQMLARHSDINLTMNTYTMLGVLDQAAAVEALPPIPPGMQTNEAERLRATGTDGRWAKDSAAKKAPITANGTPEKVPTMVPRGAGNGAKRLAPDVLRIAPDCTNECEKQSTPAAPENAKSPDEIGTSCTAMQLPASGCAIECESRESNPDALRHWILSPARLPIPPLSQFAPPVAR